MIDSLRFNTVFNPNEFNKKVTIVGAGAVGSKIAMECAKTGIEKIKVIDFDKIEPHNIGNQIFGENDIGKFKVEALRERIKQDCCVDIEILTTKFEPGQKFDAGIIIMAVDSMKARKEIWEKSVKFQFQIDLYLEGRMGTDEGRFYTVNPKNMEQIKKYEETLYEDKDAFVSPCGTVPSIGSTSSMVAAMMVWNIIKWHDNPKYTEQKFQKYGETIFGTRPFFIQEFDWE